MSDIDPQSAVSTVWKQQSVWSRAANATRRRIIRARRTVAGLTIGAATAGVAAAQLGDVHRDVSRILAVLAASALLLVPLAARGTARERIDAWTRMRSMSEALKAETFRYLAGVHPFSGPDRAAVLLERFDALTDDAADLLGHTVGLRSDAGPLPEVTDLPSYRRHRVQRQCEHYYRPAARRMERSATAIRRVTVGLTLASAVLSGVVGVFGNATLAAWVGVLATATSALVGYGAAQQYEHLQMEYARTADRLERLQHARDTGRAYTDDDSFVAEAERIVSVSNEAWRAKLIEEVSVEQS
ncbi:DUF4231 domain-containing protein [Plantactinospora sonchi]|uniref:DUF4231 domain-containing protein n=1 Tax=Plantactinospora sonchi TaxID=1544735 RepID=A0ABU7S3T4_9ACTN